MGSERNRGFADGVGGLTGVDDLGDPGDPVLEDALETSLEGDRGSRARDAGTDELNGDNACDLIDIVQHDIAVVGLDGRADDFDDLFDLSAHPRSLGRWCSSHHQRHSTARRRGRGRRVKSWKTASVQSLILAHQGGWDEALMVLVPIGLFIAVLRLANRRAKQVQTTRLQAAQSDDNESTEPKSTEPESTEPESTD